MPSPVLLSSPRERKPEHLTETTTHHSIILGGSIHFLSCYWTIGREWFETAHVIYLLSTVALVETGNGGGGFTWGIIIFKKYWKVAISVPISSWSPHSTLRSTYYLAVSLFSLLFLFLLLIPTPSALGCLMNSKFSDLKSNYISWTLSQAQFLVYLCKTKSC